MATGDHIGVVSQYSVPVDNHTAVQIRHTSEVSASDAVYAQVKSDLEKAGLTLVRLLRIDNTDLLEKFRLESDQLKKLKQKDKDWCASLSSISNKRTIFRRISARSATSFAKVNTWLYFQLNIQNLYHGTSAPLELICEEGLDERLSRRGRFGRGIYLSDNPGKCCIYAGSRSREPFLLRCQVILGDIKEFPSGEQDETLTREPMKGVSDGKRVYYDSVKGHPADHTEYVIYDKRRILLEYIAFYSCPSIERVSRRRRTKSCQSDPGASLPDGATASGSRPESPERTSSSRSSSGSESRSPGGSRDGSPAGSPRDNRVPQVQPRKRGGASAQPQLGSEGPPSASATQMSASSIGQVAISKSAEEQQRLAFKQMLDLKGNISEGDLNDLISSWTSTYGSIPLENPSGGGSGVVPFDASVDDEDDPVMEVKRKLVLDFKEITCCSDDDLCLQFIEQYNMDLNAAIEAYICRNTD